jgi:micrococcal nuclease
MYEYKARLRRVVDGDTVDLDVELGFHMTAALRFRLLDIDTPELRDKDPAERMKAQDAKNFVKDVLSAGAGDWPLAIETRKADSFGRWLVHVHYQDAEGNWTDLGAKLLESGLAVPYR